jgi:hypothetical protein
MANITDTSVGIDSNPIITVQVFVADIGFGSDSVWKIIRSSSKPPVGCTISFRQSRVEWLIRTATIMGDVR